MSEDKIHDVKLIPDEVFAKSHLLQKLQARGLYDQNAESNHWNGSFEKFQIIPDSVFISKGHWAEVFLKGDLYKNKVDKINRIDLPRNIALSIMAERGKINPPIEPYVNYISIFVDKVIKKAGEEASKELGYTRTIPKISDSQDEYDVKMQKEWNTKFIIKFMSFIVAIIETTSPKIILGELPLTLSAANSS